MQRSLDGALWDDASGLYLAADIDNREPDVWGSAFAVDLSLTSPARATRIASAIAAQSSKIFQRGQARHLVAPAVWTRCITGSCPTPGTYQVGAGVY